LVRRPRLELLLDPAADRIVAAGEEVGVVRVEALHAGSCAPNTTMGARAAMARRQCRVAFRRVPDMRGSKRVGIHRGLRNAHTALGFDPRDGEHEVGVDEPVARRHWCPIVQQRRVPDHGGTAGMCAHHDLEVGLWWTAEERRELGDVVGAGGHAANCTDGRPYTLAVVGDSGQPSGFLSENEWRSLETTGRSRRFRARQRLFREGESGDHVLAIRSGRVKVSIQTRSGREILLAVKEAGELVGELSVIDGRPRSATATALDSVDAVVVPAPAFAEFIESHPRIAVRLLRALAAQIRDADRRSVDRDTGDITCRVARRLVDLAERLGEHRGSGLEITLALSQDDLAAWVGATREATSRALGRLRAEGALTTGRQRIVLTDLAALRSRARDPA
jgi:CRP/FNR family cyclic AMP-dependent transcriptional regulator